MSRLVLAAVIALAPVVVLAQKTSFDYDKTANFAAYRTYAMREGTPAGDPLVDQRLAAAVESELAGKGLSKSDTPDVFVAYHVSVDKQKDISAWNTGGPYGWGWGGAWGSTDIRVSEILVGTLIVDVVDAAKKQIVWRGMGVKEINPQAKAEKRDKNVKNAVQKMFKNYPPKMKSNTNP